MKFTETVLGDLLPMVFLAYWLYAFIGFVFHLIVDILKRKKESKNSPYKWDWSYYWADNRERLIISFIALPFAVVFSKFITGDVMNIYLAFCTGYGIDSLIDVLKQKNIIKNCKV